MKFVPVGGKHTIGVSIKGKHVTGSPLEINSKSAVDKCVVEGPGIRDVTEKAATEFQVDIKDKRGHRVNLDEKEIQVEIHSESGNIECKVTKDKDGKFHISYVPVAGKLDISVKVQGKEIEGSPFKVNSARFLDSNNIIAEGKVIVTYES